MGFYVANEKSFYERENLNVVIRSGGPGVDGVKSLVAGDADVAIEWLPEAMALRENGVPIVNVAQIFQRSGMTIVCLRDRGIRTAEDIRGKTVALWLSGDEQPFFHLLNQLRIGPDEVHIEKQGADVSMLINGRADCVSAMGYNEYWQILDSGILPKDLIVFQFEDMGLGTLEDGLYVLEDRLKDQVFVDRLTRFVRSSLKGWRYAAEHLDEAVALTLYQDPQLDRRHQERMAKEVMSLVNSGGELGLLDLSSYDRTVDLLLRGKSDRHLIHHSPRGVYTHDIWYRANEGNHVGEIFRVSTRYTLKKVLHARWFYLLDLIGTIAFGTAGFLRARERKYDLWGAFVLTFLPAVGGGTLRDLLVGGERHPPFIFKDPVYLYIVVGIVILGTVLTSRMKISPSMDQRLHRWLAVLDTIGLSVFTIIGAKVAIAAELHWIWIPICSALTCAGGGSLLDVVTGREPRTFQGEVYEEVAIIGGLFLAVFLVAANSMTDASYLYVVSSIVLTLVLTFTLRMLIVSKNLRSPRLGFAKQPDRNGMKIACSDQGAGKYSSDARCVQSTEVGEASQEIIF